MIFHVWFFIFLPSCSECFARRTAVWGQRHFHGVESFPLPQCILSLATPSAEPPHPVSCVTFLVTTGLFVPTGWMSPTKRDAILLKKSDCVCVLLSCLFKTSTKSTSTMIICLRKVFCKCKLAKGTKSWSLESNRQRNTFKEKTTLQMLSSEVHLSEK